MIKMRKILNKVLNVLAGTSFLAMVILTCWQVFTRYVMKMPSSWSEELVSYLFAWMSLLGASLVVGERGHMNIPVIIERFSPNWQKIIAIFAEVVAFLFSAVILVYGGIQITSLAMGQLMSSMPIAVGVFYIVLPLSGVINMIYTTINIHDIIKGTISVLPISEEDEVIRKTEKVA